MSRPLALLLVLAASAAAGLLLFFPGQAPRVAPPPDSAAPAAESCDTTDSCSALPAAGASGEAARPATELPPASTPASTPADKAGPPAAVTQAEAVKLRDEADRLLAEGELRQGLELLRKATAADPSARNHGDLGALLEKLTDQTMALVHLRAAAELDPHNADRWIALANAYYRATDPGEAWKAERRAIEAEPGLELGRNSLGQRVRKGDSEPRKP